MPSQRQSTAVNASQRRTRILQVEVAKNVSRALIASMGAFQDCEDRFLDSISVLLREACFRPLFTSCRIDWMHLQAVPLCRMYRRRHHTGCTGGATVRDVREAPSYD